MTKGRLKSVRQSRCLFDGKVWEVVNVVTKSDLGNRKDGERGRERYAGLEAEDQG